MYSPLKRSLMIFAPILAIAALSVCLVSPAAAQFTGSATYFPVQNQYYVTGNATLFGDASNRDVYVGKSGPTGFNTLAGSFTLNIVAGAQTINPGVINSYGAHKIMMTGGTINEIVSWDTGTTTMTGGTADTIQAVGYSLAQIGGGNVNVGVSGYKGTLALRGGNMGTGLALDSSRMFVNGGQADFVYGYDNSLVDVSGGTVTGLTCYNGSLARIRSGSLPNGIQIRDFSTADFVGTNLRYKYYGFNTQANRDYFVIYGYFTGGVYAQYNLFINNPSGTGGVPNSTPHRFTFNGITP